MNYTGKCYDSFAYAVTTLLETAGVKDAKNLPDADCLSNRAFAFALGDDVKTWFRPALPWRDYMSILSENLGCGDGLCVMPVQDLAVRPEHYQGWFLLGETEVLKRQTLQAKYSECTPSFCLCRRERPGYYILNDPLGNPYNLFGETELLRIAEQSSGFLATFRRGSIFTPACPKDVIHSMIKRRRQAPTLCLSESGPISEHCWTDSRKNRISLEFGLRNYQIQLNKVVTYCSQAELLDCETVADLDARLIYLKIEWEHFLFDSIWSLEQKLWDELEKGVNKWS